MSYFCWVKNTVAGKLIVKIVKELFEQVVCSSTSTLNCLENVDLPTQTK